jgi:hypothetical protein
MAFRHTSQRTKATSPSPITLDDTPPKNEVSHLAQRICDKLDNENIALNDNGGYQLKITQLGIDIVKSGGYLAYLDEKAKQVKINTERQRVSDDLATWTLRQTRMQVKWFKPITIIALIGGLLSIFTTIRTHLQQSNIDSLEIQAKSTQQSLDSLKKVYLIHTKTTKSK